MIKFKFQHFYWIYPVPSIDNLDITIKDSILQFCTTVKETEMSSASRNPKNFQVWSAQVTILLFWYSKSKISADSTILQLAGQLSLVPEHFLRLRAAATSVLVLPWLCSKNSSLSTCFGDGNLDFGFSMPSSFAPTQDIECCYWSRGKPKLFSRIYLKIAVRVLLMLIAAPPRQMLRLFDLSAYAMTKAHLKFG